MHVENVEIAYLKYKLPFQNDKLVKWFPFFFFLCHAFFLIRGPSKAVLIRGPNKGSEYGVLIKGS